MRDVIHVERRPSTGGAGPSGSGSFDGAWDGPAIDGDSLTALARVADEVLPSIVARLAVSTLGELEVRHGDWHIRVRRAARGGQAPATGAPTTASPVPAGPAIPSTASSPTRSGDIASSPAVGYFAPRPDLAIGTRVIQGDVLGWIDVLGVRQEVVAPVGGLVGKVLVGPGDPVEYGEELVQLVGAGGPSERGVQGGAEA